jgi:peptide-methionine (S)-S-oxide reductase
MGLLQTERPAQVSVPIFGRCRMHQQYLAKNPAGYCGIAGTGMSCPVGIAKTD